MKAIFAIARAHFRQEWKLALLPLVVGGVVLSLRVLDGVVPKWVPEDLGLFAAFSLPSVVAVLLGLNLVAPDFRHRRLSFFFSRPCSPGQLWWGRLLGALPVLILAFVPMAVVAILGGPGVNSSPDFAAQSWLLLIPLALLLLATNAAACILSSFAWDAFLFDLAAGSAIAASAYWSVGRVLEVVGWPATGMEMFLAVPIAFGSALLPAGFAYLSGGKGRIGWGHRWFSWTLWPIVALSVVGINVWRAHEARTTLAGILRYPAWGRALDEHRVLINLWEGKDFPRWFAIDLQTGAQERVGILGQTRVVSANGEWVAQVRFEMPTPFRPGDELSLVLSRTASIHAPLRVVKGTFSPTDLSDDGERALFRENGGLEVRDTRTGDIVGRLPMPGTTTVTSARFVDNRSVETVLSEPSVFRLVRFAVDGTVLQEERIARSQGARLVEHDTTGRRAVVEQAQTVLYDREGKTLGTLAGSNQSAFFLSSGSLVVTSSRAPYPATPANSFALLVGDGTAARILPNAGSVMEFIGELSTGEIVARAPVNGRPNSVLLDPVTLTIRARFEGAEPLRTMKEASGRSNTVAQQAMRRVFQNEDGDLFYLDPGATKLRLLIKSTREDFQ